MSKKPETLRHAILRLEKIRAQRDALLAVVNKLEYSSDGYIKRYPEESEVSAAIKQAEGEKT